jgi:hypothetical protein
LISFIVFLSTLIHGTTIPMFALGSSLHPDFHPRFLVRADPVQASEDGEHTPLLHDSPDEREQGEDITQAEIDQILQGDNHADVESLDPGQQDALIGKGSGLKDWGRGRVTVFVEGDKLLICDQEGASGAKWCGLEGADMRRQCIDTQDPTLTM